MWRTLQKSGSRALIRNFSTGNFSPAVAGRSREELHALALSMNKQHHDKLNAVFESEEDEYMATIPRNLKFHFRDTMIEREYKKRQQMYYYMQENYGYMDDILVKKGLLSGEEVAAKKEKIQKSLQAPVRDLYAVPSSVSLDQLRLLEDHFKVPADMRVQTTDSREEQKKKVQEQVRLYIAQCTAALQEIPSTTAEVQAKFKGELFPAMKKPVDVDEVFLENEQLLADCELVDEASIKAKMEEIRVMATEASGKLELNDFTKSEPLQKLGLLRRGTLEKLGADLTKSLKLATKCSNEFSLRYGALPELDNDPYLLEYDEQMAFIKKRKEAKIKADFEKKMGEGEGDGEADGEVVESKPGMMLAQDDIKEAASYAAQRTPRKYLSEEKEDGEQWPKVVDGLELDKYQHLRDVDYEEFENPPDAFETRLLDAFALQRQLRVAKEKSRVVVPRVHVPASPADGSTIAKTLLLYRMAALRKYIKEIKAKQAWEHAIAYRDLKGLKLELKHDEENPWKQDLMEEVMLVLRNNGNWTTGRKEEFMMQMHKILSSHRTSEEYLSKFEY